MHDEIVASPFGLWDRLLYYTLISKKSIAESRSLWDIASYLKKA